MKKFLAICLIFLTNCVFDPQTKETLCIHNNTEYAIYIYTVIGDDSLSMKNQLKLFQLMPPGCTDANGNDLSGQKISPDYRINAYKFEHICFPINVNTTKEIKEKRIKFYFISENVMRTYKWRDIVEKQLYEKMKIYSFEQLKATNWVVTYP